MRLRTAHLSLVITLLLCTEAGAARNEETLQVPGLFMFGNLSHTLGLSYNYTGHTTSGNTTSTSQLKERYGVSTAMAILDPDLLTIQLAGGVSYTQEYGSAPIKLLDWDYNITASAWDVSYHPVTYTTSRSTTMISNGYTPSYSLTQTTDQLSASLVHPVLPLQMSYIHGTSATSGLQLDTTSSSDSVNFATEHNYHDNSLSTLSASYTTSKTSDTNSRGYTATFSNSLTFDKKHRYQLSSNVNASDNQSGNIPQQTFTFGEFLSLGFGDALTALVSDQYNKTSTVDFNNLPQTQWTNTISGGLTHHLFNSLVTSLSANLVEGNLLGGTQESYGGTLSLAYTKKLPAQSIFTLTAIGQEQVNSQNLLSSELAVRDETHLVVRQGEVDTLGVSGRIIALVSVRSQNPDIIYAEGVDYRVDFLLGQITIIIGGRIAPGVNLLISYTVAVNPSVSTLTQSKSTTANLSFFSGRYNLGASYATQDQSLIAGTASSQALVSSTNYGLRADANFTSTTVSAEYGAVESTLEKNSHYAGYLTYLTNLTGMDTASLSLSDIYTTYPAISNQSQGYTDNSASLSASYGRQFLDFIQVSLSLSCNDERRAGITSDSVLARVGLNGVYNLLTFSMSGVSRYRYQGATANIDNSLQFSITRIF